MEYVIGFFIALFIALTGVGAGTITVPVLVLFLGVPAPVAVGIGLTFSAAVKLILAPAQIARRNVAWRTLGYMLLGGVPGVLVGSLLLRHLISTGSANLLNAILGAILVTTAAWQIFYFLPSVRHKLECTRPQPRAGVADVSRGRGGGVFFGGSGRIGQRRAAKPDAARTGAGGRHRHRLRLSGFAHRQRRALVYARHESRVAAASHRGRRDWGSWRNVREHARSAPSAALALWVWLLILGGQFLFNSYRVWASPNAHKILTPVVHDQSARNNIPRG